MSNTSSPKADAFFASRAGVCVYVMVQGRSIRVCFPSPGAEGRIEDGGTAEQSAAALAAATAAFASYRDALKPLFAQIAEASRAEATEAPARQ